MLAALTGLGLSAAAGLNAYIPLLLVGLVARNSDVVTLPADFAWIENEWVLGAVAVLLLAEMVLDKVAVVDHVNDAVQTFVRPAVGGVIFAATTAAGQVDASPWMQEHPWVGWLAGIVVAGLVHAGKASARPVVNATTFGLGTPVVSAAEDATSLGMSLIALFAPLLVVLGLLLLVLGMVLGVRQLRRRRRRPAPAWPAAGVPPGGRTVPPGG
jgi:hypothetical protein